jgi:carboxypeptidase C (cathepsin A)
MIADRVASLVFQRKQVIAVHYLRYFILGWLIAGPSAVRAAETAIKGAAKPKPVTSSADALSRTRHTVTVNGTKIEYEATAGPLVLKDDDDKEKARIFFIAYTKTVVKDYSRRPLTFVFNGGPGSSSVWLHLGAFGPRRVFLGPPGQPVAPPYRLVNNDTSLLDLTDLVFIDPVTTGYSRAAKGQKPDQFHGVEEDIRTVAEFIRLYTTRNERWASPKFLAGESYGTTRAAGLVGHLQDQMGMNFNGVVLISSVLNFGTLVSNEGNDLPYILFLPSYTATAWYHKALADDLQADRARALAEAEKFALGQYATALLKGDTLDPAEKQKVARQLARLTGLSEAFVRRSNLRVGMGRFGKELLRGRRRTVGRYDSRYLGTDPDSAGERAGYDPSYAAVQGPYTACLNNYLRKELDYKTDVPYRILTGRVHPWNFGSAGRNRYLNVAPTLRDAMTKNPGLRLFVASGLYDLATPYFATDYTLSHLGPEKSLRNHVTTAAYDAGHMMYIDPASGQKLKKDLAVFYQSVFAGNGGVK